MSKVKNNQPRWVRIDLQCMQLLEGDNVVGTLYIRSGYTVEMVAMLAPAAAEQVDWLTTKIKPVPYRDQLPNAKLIEGKQSNSENPLDATKSVVDTSVGQIAKLLGMPEDRVHVRVTIGPEQSEPKLSYDAIMEEAKTLIRRRLGTLEPKNIEIKCTF